MCREKWTALVFAGAPGSCENELQGPQKGKLEGAKGIGKTYHGLVVLLDLDRLSLLLSP